MKKKMGSNFHNWIQLGDSFILSYLLTNDIYPVYLFSIAHAMEAYLKAAIVKQEGVDRAIKEGHNLYKMFKKLKADPIFLPSINIHESLFQKFTIATPPPTNLKHSEEREMGEYHHYLILFKYCADLKYFGAALKGIQSEGGYGFGTTFPEFRYTEFFFGIRKYLEFNILENQFHDRLKAGLNELFDNKENERRFLEECINGK